MRSSAAHPDPVARDQGKEQSVVRSRFLAVAQASHRHTHDGGQGRQQGPGLAMGSLAAAEVLTTGIITVAAQSPSE